MMVQPATPGVDDGETHLIRADRLAWLFEYDGDLSDTHAIRNAMQTGIGSEVVVDLKECR